MISIIYENKEILTKKLIGDRIFFSKNTPTYIGIERKYDSITCTVIFIDHGVWQYNFLNTTPSDKIYISLYDFLDKIVDNLK